MQKFRKKPVVIEAIQLTRENAVKVMSLSDNMKVRNITQTTDEGILIPTLEGVMLARYGDYVIKGVNDEFYPCKPDIFEKTYEKVEDES